MQAAALAHEVAGNRMGAAQSMDAPLGLQRHLAVPLFATSAVTGSGIPLLHAFLASLRSTAQPAASALVRLHPQGSRQNLPSKVLPFVMSSPASLTCSASPGGIAARRKLPIAGLFGSSNKVEGVLPRVLPAGRTFCHRL